MTILKSEEELDSFLSENRNWLHDSKFRAVCRRYEFPDKPLTLVIDNYYIDPTYRDIYYHYLSRLHSDCPRACKRIFLFQGAHTREDFLNVSDEQVKADFQQNFLGTIVVRMAYSSGGLSYTFGRTLLDPSKMALRERLHGGEEGDIIYEEGDIIHDEDGQPLRPAFLQKRSYRAHLLGNTYTVKAFPFSGQDGVVLTCAENAIEVLCDYAYRTSNFSSKILPSDIQEKLKARSPQRILPSHGLCTEDISYLLREFDFSPMIYSREHDASKAGDVASEKGLGCQHETDYKKWFHYYVESGIPVVTITAPGGIEQAIDENANKHAVLVIGHGRRRKPLSECVFQWLDNGLPCVDTAEFYEYYVVQDDNQIPYCEEQFDHFTAKGNYRLDSYIVPLPRHVFLEAFDAVSICDTLIANMGNNWKTVFAKIEQEAAHTRKMFEQLDVFSKGNAKKLYKKIEKELYEKIESVHVSEQNPLVVRYFLANSADYKQSRILNGGKASEANTLFYSSIPMPKSIWVAEISTYQLYKKGKAFAEIVLDATAPKLSKLESVLLIRLSDQGGYSMPSSSYDDLIEQIDSKEYANLPTLYQMYSNF